MIALLKGGAIMVRCADCGFLASRNIETRQLEETEQEIRENGGLVVLVNAGRPSGICEPPICFMQATEYKSVPLSIRLGPHYDKEKESVLSEIQRDRECKSFTAWQQGFTPKEHREMLDRQFIMDREDRRDRQARKMRYAEFIVALVALGLIVLAAFIERGGQPTINIITPNPNEVTIEQQP